MVSWKGGWLRVRVRVRVRVSGGGEGDGEGWGWVCTWKRRFSSESAAYVSGTK